MKKKFVAALCSFALALAMPMAALADESPEITVDGDTTTVDFGEDGYGSGETYNAETGEWEFVAPLKSIEIAGAEGIEVNTDVWVPGEYNEEYVPEGYDADAWKEYVEKINQVRADKGSTMFTIEINGEVTADDHAVVTFQLDKDKYGNQVISYYILHKDGSIQEKVVRVHADGTVTIWMESFSIITFMDVDGITKYENMVQPQDGDLLSPKTGC